MFVRQTPSPKVSVRACREAAVTECKWTEWVDRHRETTTCCLGEWGVEMGAWELHNPSPLILSLGQQEKALQVRSADPPIWGEEVTIQQGIWGTPTIHAYCTESFSYSCSHNGE